MMSSSQKKTIKKKISPKSSKTKLSKDEPSSKQAKTKKSKPSNPLSKTKPQSEIRNVSQEINIPTKVVQSHIPERPFPVASTSQAIYSPTIKSPTYSIKDTSSVNYSDVSTDSEIERIRQEIYGDLYDSTKSEALSPSMKDEDISDFELPQFHDVSELLMDISPERTSPTAEPTGEGSKVLIFRDALPRTITTETKILSPVPGPSIVSRRISTSSRQEFLTIPIPPKTLSKKISKASDFITKSTPVTVKISPGIQRTPILEKPPHIPLPEIQISDFSSPVTVTDSLLKTPIQRIIVPYSIPAPLRNMVIARRSVRTIPEQQLQEPLLSSVTITQTPLRGIPHSSRRLYIEQMIPNSQYPTAATPSSTTKMSPNIQTISPDSISPHLKISPNTQEIPFSSELRSTGEQVEYTPPGFVPYTYETFEYRSPYTPLTDMQMPEFLSPASILDTPSRTPILSQRIIVPYSIPAPLRDKVPSRRTMPTDLEQKIFSSVPLAQTPFRRIPRTGRRLYDNQIIPTSPIPVELPSATIRESPNVRVSSPEFAINEEHSVIRTGVQSIPQPLNYAFEEVAVSTPPGFIPYAFQPIEYLSPESSTPLSQVEQPEFLSPVSVLDSPSRTPSFQRIIIPYIISTPARHRNISRHEVLSFPKSQLIKTPLRKVSVPPRRLKMASPQRNIPTILEKQTTSVPSTSQEAFPTRHKMPVKSVSSKIPTKIPSVKHAVSVTRRIIQSPSPRRVIRPSSRTTMIPSFRSGIDSREISGPSRSAILISSRSAIPVSSRSTIPISSRNAIPIPSKMTIPVLSKSGMLDPSKSAIVIPSRSVIPASTTTENLVLTTTAITTPPVQLTVTSPVPSTNTISYSPKHGTPISIIPTKLTDSQSHGAVGTTETSPKEIIIRTPTRPIKIVEPTSSPIVLSDQSTILTPTSSIKFESKGPTVLSPIKTLEGSPSTPASKAQAAQSTNLIEPTFTAPTTMSVPSPEVTKITKSSPVQAKSSPQTVSLHEAAADVPVSSITMSAPISSKLIVAQPDEIIMSTPTPQVIVESSPYTEESSQSVKLSTSTSPKVSFSPKKQIQVTVSENIIPKIIIESVESDIIESYASSPIPSISPGAPLEVPSFSSPIFSPIIVSPTFSIKDTSTTNYDDISSGFDVEKIFKDVYGDLYESYERNIPSLKSDELEYLSEPEILSPDILKDFYDVNDILNSTTGAGIEGTLLSPSTSARTDINEEIASPFLSTSQQEIFLPSSDMYNIVYSSPLSPAAVPQAATLTETPRGIFYYPPTSVIGYSPESSVPYISDTGSEDDSEFRFITTAKPKYKGGPAYGFPGAELIVEDEWKDVSFPGFGDSPIYQYFLPLIPRQYRRRSDVLPTPEPFSRDPYVRERFKPQEVNESLLDTEWLSGSVYFQNVSAKPPIYTNRQQDQREFYAISSAAPPIQPEFTSPSSPMEIKTVTLTPSQILVHSVPSEITSGPQMSREKYNRYMSEMLSILEELNNLLPEYSVPLPSTPPVYIPVDYETPDTAKTEQIIQDQIHDISRYTSPARETPFRQRDRREFDTISPVEFPIQLELASPPSPMEIKTITLTPSQILVHSVPPEIISTSQISDQVSMPTNFGSASPPAETKTITLTPIQQEVLSSKHIETLRTPKIISPSDKLPESSIFTSIGSRQYTPLVSPGPQFSPFIRFDTSPVPPITTDFSEKLQEPSVFSPPGLQHHSPTDRYYKYLSDMISILQDFNKNYKPLELSTPLPSTPPVYIPIDYETPDATKTEETIKHQIQNISPYISPSLEILDPFVEGFNDDLLQLDENIFEYFEILDPFVEGFNDDLLQLDENISSSPILTRPLSPPIPATIKRIWHPRLQTRLEKVKEKVTPMIGTVPISNVSPMTPIQDPILRRRWIDPSVHTPPVFIPFEYESPNLIEETPPLQMSFVHYAENIPDVIQKRERPLSPRKTAFIGPVNKLIRTPVLPPIIDFIRTPEKLHPENYLFPNMPSSVEQIPANLIPDKRIHYEWSPRRKRPLLSPEATPGVRTRPRIGGMLHSKPIRRIDFDQVPIPSTPPIDTEPPLIRFDVSPVKPAIISPTYKLPEPSIFSPIGARQYTPLVSSGPQFSPFIRFGASPVPPITTDLSDKLQEPSIFSPPGLQHHSPTDRYYKYLSDMISILQEFNKNYKPLELSIPLPSTPPVYIPIDYETPDVTKIEKTIKDQIQNISPYISPSLEILDPFVEGFNDDLLQLDENISSSPILTRPLSPPIPAIIKRIWHPRLQTHLEKVKEKVTPMIGTVPISNVSPMTPIQDPTLHRPWIDPSVHTPPVFIPFEYEPPDLIEETPPLQMSFVHYAENIPDIVQKRERQLSPRKTAFIGPVNKLIRTPVLPPIIDFIRTPEKLHPENYLFPNVPSSVEQMPANLIPDKRIHYEWSPRRRRPLLSPEVTPGVRTRPRIGGMLHSKPIRRINFDQAPIPSTPPLDTEPPLIRFDVSPVTPTVPVEANVFPRNRLAFYPPKPHPSPKLKPANLPRTWDQFRIYEAPVTLLSEESPVRLPYSPTSSPVSDISLDLAEVCRHINTPQPFDKSPEPSVFSPPGLQEYAAKERYLSEMISFIQDFNKSSEVPTQSLPPTPPVYIPIDYETPYETVEEFIQSPSPSPKIDLTGWSTPPGLLIPYFFSPPSYKTPDPFSESYQYFSPHTPLSAVDVSLASAPPPTPPRYEPLEPLQYKTPNPFQESYILQQSPLSDVDISLVSSPPPSPDPFHKSYLSAHTPLSDINLSLASSLQSTPVLIKTPTKMYPRGIVATEAIPSSNAPSSPILMSKSPLSPMGIKTVTVTPSQILIHPIPPKIARQIHQPNVHGTPQSTLPSKRESKIPRVPFRKKNRPVKSAILTQMPVQPLARTRIPQAPPTPKYDIIQNISPPLQYEDQFPEISLRPSDIYNINQPQFSNTGYEKFPLKERSFIISSPFKGYGEEITDTSPMQTELYNEELGFKWVNR